MRDYLYYVTREDLPTSNVFAERACKAQILLPDCAIYLPFNTQTLSLNTSIIGWNSLHVVYLPSYLRAGMLFSQKKHLKVLKNYAIYQN